MPRDFHVRPLIAGIIVVAVIAAFAGYSYVRTWAPAPSTALQTVPAPLVAEALPSETGAETAVVSGTLGAAIYEHSQNPAADTIPSTNPFEKKDTNPMVGVYTNPFE
jgi:hypothetical protein